VGLLIFLTHLSIVSQWERNENFDFQRPDIELSSNVQYEFSLPFGSYVETCTSFYVFFRTQKAERLGRLLDPYPTAPLFVPFPSSNAPAPAPLASTHCRLPVCVEVWRNSPSVTSIRLISGGHKIVTFVTKAFGRDRRLKNNRTRTRKIDEKINV
jgi:hypothetical protein